MKKGLIFWVFLLAVLSVTPILAQKTDKEKKNENPNFSGTWIYDESKSNRSMKELFKSSKKPSDLARKTTRKLIIEHTEDYLKTTEIVSVELFDEKGTVAEKIDTTIPSKIYYTDKRGEQNIDEKNQTIDSITKWNDKQIMVVIKDKKSDQISSILFLLSKDGQELTIRYSSFKSDNGAVYPSGFGDRVFNRAN